MACVLNLRGDLAKLSDAELAERLVSAWNSYDETDRKSRFDLWYSRRGPIRHPLVYRLFSIAGVGRGLTMNSLGTGPFIRWDAYGMHLTICEIRDLQDEIERRLSVAAPEPHEGVATSP